MIINILKGISVFKLWSRPGSKDMERTWNYSFKMPESEKKGSNSTKHLRNRFKS